MADSDQFTVFNAETQQPMTVTVNQQNTDEAQSVPGIQYITTQDGMQVQVAQVPQSQEGSEPTMFNLTNANFTTQATTQSNQESVSVMVPQQTATPTVVQNNTQSLIQTPVVQQPQTNLATPAGTGTIAGVPQMLFLNQVTVNGQTSFVLVDANNKPVQLPQGIQVINLPSGGGAGGGGNTTGSNTTSTAGSSLPMPADSGEEPLYVNAKQYHRILKRRQARAKLEALGKIPKERQKYLYESRHRHAVNRSRGSGGVFVRGKDDLPEKPLSFSGQINNQVVSSKPQPTANLYIQSKPDPDSALNQVHHMVEHELANASQGVQISRPFDAISSHTDILTTLAST